MRASGRVSGLAVET